MTIIVFLFLGIVIVAVIVDSIIRAKKQAIPETNRIMQTTTANETSPTETGRMKVREILAKDIEKKPPKTKGTINEILQTEEKVSDESLLPDPFKEKNG